MAKRRLFRRRTNGEWFRENAYIGVAVLALVCGAVGWTAMFDGQGSQSEFATAELLTGSDTSGGPSTVNDGVSFSEADEVTAPASTPEPSAPVATTTPATTVDIAANEHTPSRSTTDSPAVADSAGLPATATVTPPAPASDVPVASAPAAPAATAETKPSPVTIQPQVSEAQTTTEKTVTAKGRAVARSTRSARSSTAVERRRTASRTAKSSRPIRYALAARTVERRRMPGRRAQAHASEQRLALATQAPRAKMDDDDLDEPYSPPPPVVRERRSPHRAKIDPAWKEEIERGLNEMECTRSFGAFGAPRRLPTDC